MDIPLSRGSPSSFGQVRDTEATERGDISEELDTGVPMAHSKGPKVPSYRVHKQAQPRFRGNPVATSSSHSQLREQDAKATALFRLWKSNPNKLPTPEVFHFLNQNFKLPPELLREKFHKRPEDSGYFTTATSKPDPTLTYEKKQCNRRKPDPRTDGTLAPNLKNNELPFACTHQCGRRFAKKGAWVKHEETHYPQQLWVCFIPSCPENEKPWLRRDHFGKHFKKDHKDIEMLEQHYKISRLPINSRYPRKCHFKRCEYRSFVDWRDRNDHIAWHYKTDYAMSDWGILNDETRESDDVANAGLEDSRRNFPGEDDSNDRDRHNSNFKDPNNGPGTGGSGSASGSGNGRDSDGQGPSGSQPGYGHQHPGGSTNAGSSQYEGRQHFYGGHQMRLRTQHKMTLCSSVSMNLTLISHKLGIGNVDRVHALRTRIRPHWIIGDFSISSIRLLGLGATATVDEVRNRGAKATMARKILRYQYPAERSQIDRETYIMHRLEHSHIVRLISTLSDTSHITLFMKPAADFTLSYYLRAPTSSALIFKETWKWFGCLVSGLQHIHGQNILHGDIKPDNILISKGHVFFADFGLSTTIPGDMSLISHAGFMTKQYAAPEVKQGRRGKPSDIWSLSFVFLELATAIVQCSTATLYMSNIQSPDKSYSNNPAVVAKWIIALQHVILGKDLPIAVSNAIDSCKAMTHVEPRDRPTVSDLAQRIPSQSCCFAFDSGVRRWDTCADSSWPAYSDISAYSGSREANIGLIYSAYLKSLLDLATKLKIEQACNLVHRERQKLRSTLTELSYLPAKQLAMLKVWLSSRECYEALPTGYLHVIQERSTSLIQEHVEHLLDQIGSQFVRTASSIKSQYAAVLDDLDIQDNSASATDQQLDRANSQGRSSSHHSHILYGVKPGEAELQVYSSADRSWINALCELDSGTRGDWVSEELLDKLGVQSEITAGKSVYMGSQGREVRTHRTVLLQWHFSTSAETRENWFHVMGGSFDIVIGSDFLCTHGLCIFDETASWARASVLEGTHTPLTHRSESNNLNLAMKEPMHDSHQAYSHENESTTSEDTTTAEELVRHDRLISLTGIIPPVDVPNSLVYAQSVTLEQPDSFIQAIPYDSIHYDHVSNEDNGNGDGLKSVPNRYSSMDFGLASCPHTLTPLEVGLNANEEAIAIEGEYTSNTGRNALLAGEASLPRANSFEPDLNDVPRDGELSNTGEVNSHHLGHDHERAVLFQTRKISRYGDLPCNLRSSRQLSGIQNAISSRRDGADNSYKILEPTFSDYCKFSGATQQETTPKSKIFPLEVCDVDGWNFPEATLLDTIPDSNQLCSESLGNGRFVGSETHYPVRRSTVQITLPRYRIQDHWWPGIKLVSQSSIKSAGRSIR